jgi:hypothetical protein
VTFLASALAHNMLGADAFYVMVTINDWLEAAFKNHRIPPLQLTFPTDDLSRTGGRGP